MTDRELLEKAAKAAGMVGWRYASPYMGMVKMIDPSRPESTGSVGPDWNPLVNKADGMALSIKMRLDIEHGSPLDNQPYVCASRCGIEMVRDPVMIIVDFDDESEREDATLRAIVSAAAEIGKAIP